MSTTKPVQSLQLATVTNGLRRHFEAAAALFAESPSASNWTALDHAMHAWQQFNGPEREAHAAYLYDKVGVGTWVEHMYQVQMREMQALKGALSATITVGRKAR
jgi:hypothetical protein